MGMQQKIDRAYTQGFKDGEKQAAEYAELRGIIKGSIETWEIVEGIFQNTKGLGPKTQEKIVGIIREYAERESKKLKAVKK
jgi:hypothetical protein